MKSIVLCENSLLKQNDNTKELKEIKENEESDIILINTPQNTTPVIPSVEHTKTFLLNGHDSFNCESDNNIVESRENSYEKLEGTSALEKGNEILSIVAEPTEFSEEDKISLENLEAESESNAECSQNLEANSSVEILGENFNEVKSNKEEVEFETIPEDKAKSNLTESETDEGKTWEENNIEKGNLCESSEITETSLSTGNSKPESNLELEEKKADDISENENEECFKNINSGLDENKENEKVDNFMEENKTLKDEDCNKCDIKVGECQTVSLVDTESIWNETQEKVADENSSIQDKQTEESEVVSDVDEGSEIAKEMSVVSEESKVVPIVSEESQENSESTDKEKVEKEIKQEIVELGDEGLNYKDKESIQMEVDQPNSYEKIEKNIEFSELEENEIESAKCKKRQNTETSDDDVATKKLKFSDDECEDEIQHLEEDSAKDSSRRETLHVFAEDSQSKTEEEIVEKFIEEDSEAQELNTIKEETTENIKADSEEKVAITSSFLASLRGTLKNLTRSDLEELIVQKLCEVITERSTVGKLRRKAQALEEDQEKWKGKVQSLTKLVREMEMIMKKYMAEVQKQKEGDSPIITPLKITRSVGLQVSFYSSANKGVKSNPTAGASSSNGIQNKNVRNMSSIPPKFPQQTNTFPKNVWNKPINQNSNYKSPPPPQKSPGAMQKKLFPTRSDGSGMQVNRPLVPNSGLNNIRSAINQVQGPRPVGVKSISGASAAQNGSKVIDLTEDDDRQSGNIGKPTGPIRVVNHLSQQSQAAQNNRFTYLLPVNGNPPGTGTSGVQNRPVFIAAPTVQQSNRQLMCSMPPLLFKGGSVAQPQSQSQSQSQALNQANRTIFPKTLRHPAPLPQQPPNQINRPSLKIPPPRPALKISKVHTGIVLSWNMTLTPEHAPISSYQLYAYQEGNTPPATSLWKKVGEVKALPLPMACTLTQFMSGHKYHFAVRAIDHHSRVGPFSFPGTIVLVK